MQYLLNRSELNFMTWETDPKLMNKNNVIGILIHEDKEINVGDFMFYNLSGDQSSTYKVIEIVDKIKSSKENHDYYYLKTQNKKIPTAEAKRLYNS